MFGSPAILALPAGFHVITTKIWSLFQFPPTLGPGRRRCAAAADHHRHSPARAEIDPRPQGLHGARRQERHAAASPNSAHGNGLAIAFVFSVLCLTVILPYAAIIKTAFTGTVGDPINLEHADLAALAFRAFRVLRDTAGAAQHVPPRLPDGDGRHRHRAGRLLPRHPPLGARRSASSASWRRPRSQSLASSSASACSSATPTRHSSSMARSGSCSSPS